MAFLVMFMVFTRPPIRGFPQMDIATISATVFPVPVRGWNGFRGDL